jgi:hypothetical protein
VRRHNDIGHICVITRRGDPIAGQIFVAVDHLNGTESLYVPAPMTARGEDTESRLFALRLDQAEPVAVAERIRREADFDPDLWVVSVEMRGGDLGLELVG